MKVGLLVEGKADEKVLELLTRRILASAGQGRTGVRVRKFRGHGGLLNARRVTDVINELCESNRDLIRVIAVIDNDCVQNRRAQSMQTEKEVAAGGVTRPPTYLLAVEALEAWLIADTSALTGVLGRPVDGVMPESLFVPADWLGRQFRRAGKTFNKVADGRRIAERVNPELAARRSESFARFRRLVEDNGQGFSQ